jgi:homoserine O-acetyltransferase
MMSPVFAGELFGPGQPLDSSKYYIILPDSIAKPSDGLRAKFPLYNYEDMVAAQYRLVAEGLGVRHLRLVLGFSMGGMHTWLWGENYPDFMDALVPMAFAARRGVGPQLDDEAPHHGWHPHRSRLEQRKLHGPAALS